MAATDDGLQQTTTHQQIKPLVSLVFVSVTTLCYNKDLAKTTLSATTNILLKQHSLLQQTHLVKTTLSATTNILLED